VTGPVAGSVHTGARTLHEDATALITAYADQDLSQRGIREAYLGFLASNPEAMYRRNVAGHLTASAVVVEPDRGAVLLTLHPRVGAWLQLGGHCEPDDHTLAYAALREAAEESGIDGLRIDPVPIHLDVHPITCSLGVPTRHFDVQFLVTAPPAAQAIRSDESLDLRWFDAADLPADAARGIPELVRRAWTRLDRSHTSGSRPMSRSILGADPSVAVEALRAVEKQRLRALVSVDRAELEDLHAPDFQLIHPGGGVWSREEYLSGIASGRIDYRQFDAVSAIDVIFEQDLAVLRYQSFIDICVAGQEPGRLLAWHIDCYRRTELRHRGRLSGHKPRQSKTEQSCAAALEHGSSHA